MRATASFLRLFIRGLAWDAQASGVPLRATLQTASRARLTESSRGKVLTGVSSGGTTSTYTLPPLGNLGADDLAEACSVILDKVDVLVAATPAITDDAIVTALLAEIKPVRAMRPDFSVDCR